jgi:hypothetical protein
MSIDFVSTNPVVVPAIPAKEFPLFWLRILSIQASGPQSPARLYSEFQPYRRITDEQGNVIGAEVKTPEVQGDIKVVDVPDIFALATSSVEQDALITQAISTFVQSGGNVASLAMACMFLAIQSYGKQTGVFMPDPVPVVEDPVVDPVVDPKENTSIENL